MYHTPAGDRILFGAERRFFIHSLSMVVDLLAGGNMEFGVTPFDELQRNQKLVVLYNAARGLLRPNEPTPKLTAFIESAVATVYQFATEQVYQEIDDPESSEGTSFWRRLVREAAREQVALDELPRDTDPDKETWAFWVECLAGRVLWDNDYEWQESLDLPPEESRQFRSMLGMADDYYTDVPDDPADDKVDLYVDALMGLTSDVSLTGSVPFCSEEIMLKIHLDKENGVAVLEPQGALSQQDFTRAAATIDPHIERSGSLKGILIHTESFPGWESLGALVQHFKFVKNHHEQIAKVALVTDSSIASVAESIAKHFVAAKIKHFPFNQREIAEQWIING